MTRIKLPGPSYTSQSVNADAQRTVNLYPEKIESGDGNTDIALYPTPGLRKFAQFGGACLSIAKTHAGDFLQGQNGATYSVTVTNNTGAASLGLVTVTENVPAGLTFVSMSGAGWTIAGNVATRTDALLPGASYPALTVTVNVAVGAPASVENSISISGGGCLQINSAQDVTAVAAPPPIENPTPFNAVNIPQGGIISGNTVIGQLSPPGHSVVTNNAIQVGDMLFVFIAYNFTANSFEVSSMIDHGPLAVWSPLSAAIRYTGPHGEPMGFQIFYGAATAPFAGASVFTLDLTFPGSPQNADMGTMSFLAVRGISSLDQLEHGTIPPGLTQVAPSITTSGNRFVLSAIEALGDNFTIAAPFFVQVGFLGFVAAWNSGTSFVAPAGTYAASWNNSAGDSIAAAYMVSFA